MGNMSVKLLFFFGQLIWEEMSFKENVYGGRDLWTMDEDLP